jgi:iron complex transport system ATP-binding protein
MTAAHLSASGVSVVLGGRTVVDAVSLDLRPGEVAAIIGPNGAGKSTLMTALAGLRKPQAGAVALGGLRLADLPDRTRAQRIGFLPQSPEIAWAVDVETLVGLGRTPWRGAFSGDLGSEDRAIVSRALEATHLVGFARRIAQTLSGGERARALIARVLAGEPEWLLADEPLTGLDPGHQFDACALLRRIADEGRGVAITLHDLSLAGRFADRVVVLQDGRIVVDAPPAEALTAALLAEVYGVDAEVTRDGAGLAIALHGRTKGAGARG